MSRRSARRRSASSTSDNAPAPAEARRSPGGLTGRAAVLGLVVCALVLGGAGVLAGLALGAAAVIGLALAL